MGPSYWHWQHNTERRERERERPGGWLVTIIDLLRVVCCLHRHRSGLAACWHWPPTSCRPTTGCLLCCGANWGAEQVWHTTQVVTAGTTPHTPVMFLWWISTCKTIQLSHSKGQRVYFCIKSALILEILIVYLDIVAKFKVVYFVFYLIDSYSISQDTFDIYS